MKGRLLTSVKAVIKSLKPFSLYNHRIIEYPSLVRTHQDHCDSITQQQPRHRRAISYDVLTKEDFTQSGGVLCSPIWQVLDVVLLFLMQLQVTESELNGS